MFSLQTFTIRKYLNSPKNIEKALAQVKNIGLNAIELARIKFKQAEIQAVANCARDMQIDVGSTQITYDFLDKNRDWVLQFHEQLRCEFSAVSVLPTRVIRGSEDSLLRFTDQLNKLGQYYRQRGLTLCFHHHDYEYRHYGEQTGLELILNNSDSENVGLVLDTYWTQRGGKSPHDVIEDFAGRIKVVHLRDYRLRWKMFDLLPIDCELGAGNLDFTRIINACRSSDVKYMAIEQATSTPFESIKKSVSHLHSLGFQRNFNQLSGEKP